MRLDLGQMLGGSSMAGKADGSGEVEVNMGGKASVCSQQRGLTRVLRCCSVSTMLDAGGDSAGGPGTGAAGRHGTGTGTAGGGRPSFHGREDRPPGVHTYSKQPLLAMLGNSSTPTPTPTIFSLSNIHIHTRTRGAASSMAHSSRLAAAPHRSQRKKRARACGSPFRP